MGLQLGSTCLHFSDNIESFLSRYYNNKNNWIRYWNRKKLILIMNIFYLLYKYKYGSGIKMLYNNIFFFLDIEMNDCIKIDNTKYNNKVIMNKINWFV